MTLTITLSADVESRLEADAQAQGKTPAAMVAELVSDAFAVPPSAADIEASAREIREALDEADQEYARGELLTLEESFAELRANAARRRQEREIKNGAASNGNTEPR